MTTITCQLTIRIMLTQAGCNGKKTSDTISIPKNAHDPRAKAIVESTVKMAKKLGMLIVAEGVETLEDWQRVEQLGCDQVQGYFVASPMPGEDIPGWVANWTVRQHTLLATQPLPQCGPREEFAGVRRCAV